VRWIPGVLVRMQRDPLRFFGELADQHGDIVRLPLGVRDFYLVNDPELIQDVLVNNSHQFEKFPRVPRSKGLFGNGLLTSEGDFHLRQRRLAQPAFHRERIQAYAELMVIAARDLRDSWRPGQEVDVSGSMNRLALEVISKALFSSNTSRDAAEIGRCLEHVLAALNRLVMPMGSLLVSIPTPANLRYRRAMRRLDAIVFEMIRARRSLSASQDDLLGMLMGEMDERQLRDEVMTLFVAGHETTANAMTWTWHLLARNPDAERCLREELCHVLGGRLPQAEDCGRLPVTEAVVAESIRLLPPVWILGRKALADYRFGDLRAPRGSVLLVCMHTLHRRPSVFSDPERFDLGRWTAAAKQSRHRYAYLPFGAGSRLCIGERFAWMEQILVLATIAQKWRLRPIEGRAVEPLPMLTLRPSPGLRMTAQPGVS